MFDQKNSASLPSATSLQESASGPTRSEEPDGPMTNRSGPEAAHASLSPRQAKKAGLMTQDTSGRLSTGSSGSACLQQLLESRLRQKLQGLGSTLYKLTWKSWVTPSGVSRSRLRASVPRISAIAPTGWPTPTTRDWKDGAECPNVPINALLGRTVWLAGWPTPRSVHSGHSTGNPDRAFDKKSRLEDTVFLAGWGTPTAHPANGTPEAFVARKEKARARGVKMGASVTDIQMQAMLAGWPTPTARDHFPAHTPEYIAAKKAQGHGMANLNDLVQSATPARLTASGQMLTGSSAGMENGGQLNPALSRWLMGLPIEWDDCADTVTPLTPRRRKSS